MTDDQLHWESSLDSQGREVWTAKDRREGWYFRILYRFRHDDVEEYLVLERHGVLPKHVGDSEVVAMTETRLWFGWFPKDNTVERLKDLAQYNYEHFKPEEIENSVARAFKESDSVSYTCPFTSLNQIKPSFTLPHYE